MTLEISFILLLIVACYFSWKWGEEEGSSLGIEAGVYATLHNLESSGVIKVINHDDGGSVIKAMAFTELHVNANGDVKTIINPFKSKEEGSICEEKK
jgi:Fe2+ or Zn2+ uptake regulation protein